MTDRYKTCLSAFFLASTFILPLVGLAIGWIYWDLKTGVVAGMAVFAILFLVAGILLAGVEDLSWLAVQLPFLFGLVYALLPDFLPGPFDDAAVLAAGAILSFTLWLKKQPDTPKWIIAPLLGASLYTLVGSILPGPVDELIVFIVAYGVTVYGGTNLLSGPTALSEEPTAGKSDVEPEQDGFSEERSATATWEQEEDLSSNVIEGEFTEIEIPVADQGDLPPPTQTGKLLPGE